ncbi:uncharacterized protein LOC124656463 [Lolium rigidum]|uniref:uncharacterized protein LOC124656463 n=1 Tax=Lolium rigidum TaxID=89674 RepID=UPI001F5CEE38|nr:uncharacterized protein LOC124656463 [Lolium rigidum]
MGHHGQPPREAGVTHVPPDPASLGENNRLDGLARALQEALARLCGQNSVAIEGERFAHFARHTSLGLPISLPFHPVLRHHVDHLDFMLFETRAELDNSRAFANHTYLQLNQQAETIKVIAKERRTLRQLVSKKYYTIHSSWGEGIQMLRVRQLCEAASQKLFHNQSTTGTILCRDKLEDRQS